MNETHLIGIEKDIKEILYSYMAIRSTTGTSKEKEVEPFLLEFFGRMTYFKEHSDYFGAFPIPGDLLERKVLWGLVKGKGNRTVVLVHHYDVVDIEDFGRLKSLAYSPDELQKELLHVADFLPQEAAEDIRSGDYVFGRGAADMKGGGAIQLALLKRYSEIEDWEGSVLVIGVPDEENLSAGMRGAAHLLTELGEKHALQYVMMMNAEPHMRRAPEKGVFALGSVGKILAFVYVRGYLSHVGKVYEGFNPVGLLSGIVSRTDVNVELTDVVGNEYAPSPTWLYLKDSKEKYDVSMPLSAAGCLSILTLDSTPEDILRKIEKISVEEFENYIQKLKLNFETLNARTGKPGWELKWKPKVMRYRELYDEALMNHGDLFREAISLKLKEVREAVRTEKMTLLESNFHILEEIFRFIEGLEPRIIIGLTPPYYPSVTNRFFHKLEERVATIHSTLREFTKEAFREDYEIEEFFTGISDLSYVGVTAGEELKRSLESGMPLFGELYDLPIHELEKIAMPCMNIGPWGKDFHKLTERVLKEDLYVRTPRILDYGIRHMLKD